MEINEKAIQKIREDFDKMIDDLTGEEVEMFKKGGKWIQKAINPKHKGFCTPMSKKTCTHHRKALARRFKSGEFRKKK